MLLKLAISLATFYHLLATVAALAGVLYMLRTVLRADRHQPFAHRMFQWGEVHLWLSGVIIVALGLVQFGVTYLDNPKLWTKVSVVLLWGLNSLCIKRYLQRSGAAGRSLMMGLSMASLIYGTFLGVAKPLAHGAASYPELMSGFALLLTACVGWLAIRLFDRSTVSVRSGHRRTAKVDEDALPAAG